MAPSAVVGSMCMRVLLRTGLPFSYQTAIQLFFFLTSPAMVVLGKVVVRGIYTYISASLHFYASEK